MMLSTFLASPATVVEGTYQGTDGRELGFVVYRQADERPGTAVVYLHGIESHAGWFEMAGRLLRDRGYDVYCLDRRGSGINRENRGFISGHADSYRTVIDDVFCFIKPLRRYYHHIYLIGLSWGGKQAVGYGLTYPDTIDGLVLITPGLKARVDVDPLTKVRVVLSSGIAPHTQIALPITATMFTVTPRYLRYIQDDVLRLKSASARFLAESHKLEKWIDNHMPENQLPILLFLAGDDRIIDNHGVEKLLQRGRQSVFDVIRYPEQTHSIQFDAPGRLVQDVDAWIHRQRAEAGRV